MSCYGRPLTGAKGQCHLNVSNRGKVGTAPHEVLAALNKAIML